MQLLVVRHARAKDRDKFAATGRPDAKRPLTKKGIRRMKEAARGLHSLVPSIGLLASSPLVRAVETAQILAKEYDDIECVRRRELAPGGDAKRLISYLASVGVRHVGRRDKAPFCIVGHEPDLGKLIELLLKDKADRPQNVKKGSATLIQFADDIAVGEGRLCWYRSAKELADLR